MGLNKKKGLFFSVDAFFAIMLLIIGVILVANYTFRDVSTEQIDLLSKDLLTSLGEMKVVDVNDSWVRDQITYGYITNTDNTVLEQIGAFWATGEMERAENLSRILVEGLVPTRYGVGIIIDDDVIYIQNKSTKALNLINSRRMITGIEQGSPIEGSAAAALIRKVKAKKTSSYAYFGGFVGQGNMSVLMENLPADIDQSTITDVTLEGYFGGDFNLKINSNTCEGPYNPVATNLSADSWNLTNCSSSFAPGDNIIEIIPTGSIDESYVSGGYLRVTYVTDEVQQVQNPETQKVYMFPGIDGVINLYDGFYVPGMLNNMEIRLHYYSSPNTSVQLYMDVGSSIVYEANASGEIDYTISNATLAAMLNYSDFDENTVPIRMGFYAGNVTEVSGNITDAFLILSRAGTMANADIEGTTMTRFEVAMNLSHEFADIALNSSGNRLGLASFFAAAQINEDLTGDVQNIHDELDNWGAPQNPADATRKLCAAVKLAKDELAAVGSERTKIVVLMSDGNGTHPCKPPGGEEEAREQTIAQACDDYAISKVTFYTIGFGDGADDELLSAIADCTGGIYRKSNNLTGLREIFQEFAQIVSESSVAYEFQRVTSATNVESELYSDSYIEVNFTSTVPPPAPEEITLMFQSEPFTSCNYDVTIPNGVNVKEAVMTSYSQDFWTSIVRVDGVDVYDLSSYGSDFAQMGDPYRIMIPANLLTPGTHTFRVIIGANVSDDQGCSQKNSLIYRGSINLSSARSEVVEFADGCDWTIETEGGEFINLSIPSDYSGTDTCSYTSASIDYKANDAYDLSIYNLLVSLDLDGDGKIVFNLEAEDMEVVVSVLTGVPYMWGPSIMEVRMWQ
ncbi:MAG: vWA domain-containing protein [archaeon]